ncbi:hypothetical protein [Niabella hibiscisoli]|uniref:hypothetical protein n=1 Tax=Niabella hibiscisoli TaxID=1825928 RepID=UPI001F0F373D|nr:hypothetical protein [Niabella hibiscisoli]MCH5719996.1 hypothetical protein [Niabella hibiscisoli]
MKKTTATLILLITFILANSQNDRRADRKLRLPKNYMAIRLAFPLVNNFNYYNYRTGKSLSSTNLLGFGIGVFYKGNRGDFSLAGGVNPSIRTPINDNFNKAWVTGEHSISSFFIDALHHRKVTKKISLLGGVNVQRFKYNLKGDGKSIRHQDDGIGLTLGGEFNMSPMFAPAILYRPVIIPLGTAKYYHTVSLAVNLNAPLVNPFKAHGFR